MKKLFLYVIALSLLGGRVNAQINLEKTFDPSSEIFSIVHFPVNGTKILILEGVDVRNVLKFYNPDYTLWKTFKIPKGYGLVQRIESYDGGNYRWEITEALFDTDPSTIEIVLYGNGGNTIVQDDGYILFESTVSSRLGLTRIGRDYKLVEYHYSQGDYYQPISWNIYSLPGTLPCNDCSNNNNGGNTGERPVTYEGAGGFLSNPIPNPSSTQVRIEYRLPSSSKNSTLQICNTTGILINSFPLKKEVQSLIIDVREMVSGTYFYYVSTEAGVSSTKKMLVVK